MPKPAFGPHVDAVRQRERRLALGQWMSDLAARMNESDDDDPEILAVISQMERVMMAIRIQTFIRRRARARIERNDDDGVVNAQLPKEEDW